jgi:choloylglycine hydrolase
MKSNIFLGLLSLALGIHTANACTGVAVTSSDGGVVVGRTLEFGESLDSNVIVWPAGSVFIGETPSGPGVKFTSKYGFIGATAANHLDFIIDGFNEKGLNVGLFYFPGYAQYEKPTADNLKRGISPGQFATWVLANFATVAEVRQNLDQISVLPVVVDLLKAVPDAHFKIQDASGECLVVEPVDGKLKAYENPVRVFTNSPGFEWHLTNLNNFLDLSSTYPVTKSVGNRKFSPFGMGAGSVGIPGDFTPPSRFVRMAFFSQNLAKPPTTTAAVSSLFHLLNTFDIPAGSAKPPAGTAEGSPDYTTWTSVSDLKKLQFHWKTFGNPTPRVIDLAQALKTAGDKPIHMSMGPQGPDAVSTSAPVAMTK